MRITIWGTAASLLLLPLIAMRFTDEVSWHRADFLIMGAMLAVACGAYELAARMTGNSTYRAAVGVAVAAAFIMIWATLAVGIIGSENNPANLMFVGVLAVAITARLQPVGMARALSATALAQALVGVIAVVAGFGSAAPSFPEAILLLTGTFAALWLLSAWLFRSAAGEQPASGTA